MTEHTMDQRDIESILFNLESDKNDLLSELHEISELLKDELELDIAMYKEMMDKLYPSEIGACGFPCDGRCPQCGGSESYDPNSEVFTGGDY